MPRQIKEEYQIIEEIGAGGMAVVHKAVQKSLNRPVAVKELKKAYHADEQIVLRFEREGMMAASLQHENIVHIYDYWKKPNYSIVMEYVDGINLAEVIDKAGAMPVDIAVMIALQVCSALEYAHMRGLIHRDIKPSNIMIRKNGEVKLMDFGIAHTRNLESLTMPGTLIGTPSYMSPEQITGDNLDIQSDIFSFGIVLYEMLTGMKPFVADDTHAVSAKILRDTFIPPRRLNGDIPRSVQRIIKKCLRKKPQKRFGSMLEIERKMGKRLEGKTTRAGSLLRISDYLVSLKVIEPVPEQESLVITANLPRHRRLKRALVTGLLLLAASGGLSYYQWWKQSPVAPPETPAARSPQPPPSAAGPAVSPSRPDQDTRNSSIPAAQAPAGASAPAIQPVPRKASIEQPKERSTPARKKKAASKKRKKANP